MNKRALGGSIETARRSYKRVNGTMREVEFDRLFVHRYDPGIETLFIRFSAAELFTAANSESQFVVVRHSISTAAVLSIQFAYEANQADSASILSLGLHIDLPDGVPDPDMELRAKVHAWRVGSEELIGRQTLHLTAARLVAGKPLFRQIAEGMFNASDSFLIEFNYQLTGLRFPNAPAGIHNYGVTCYLNSFLQSIFHIKFFRYVFNLLPGYPNDYVFALQRLFFALEEIRSQPANTNLLVGAFGWSGETSLEQQDVQEFSCFFFDAVEKSWKRAGLPEPPLTALFEGRLETYIRCTEINFESARAETFNSIALNVGFEGLESALAAYFEEERLEGDNAYRTDHAGLQPATRGTRICALPSVLTFSLNRFEYDPARDCNVKITSRFEFPQTIDLSAFEEHIKLPGNDRTAFDYRLYAVFVHVGRSAHLGHYKVLLRLDSGWWEFDDEAVAPLDWQIVRRQAFGGGVPRYTADSVLGRVNEESVESMSHAYLLMYVRASEQSRLFDFDGRRLQYPKTVFELGKAEIAKSRRRTRERTHQKITLTLPKSFEGGETGLFSLFYAESQGDSLRFKRHKTALHRKLLLPRPLLFEYLLAEAKAFAGCDVELFVETETIHLSPLERDGALADLTDDFKQFVVAVPTRSPAPMLVLFKTFDANLNRLFCARVVCFGEAATLGEALGGESAMVVESAESLLFVENARGELIALAAADRDVTLKETFRRLEVFVLNVYEVPAIAESSFRAFARSFGARVEVKLRKSDSKGALIVDVNPSDEISKIVERYNSFFESVGADQIFTLKSDKNRIETTNRTTLGEKRQSFSANKVNEIVWERVLPITKSVDFGCELRYASLRGDERFLASFKVSPPTALAPILASVQPQLDSTFEEESEWLKAKAFPFTLLAFKYCAATGERERMVAEKRPLLLNTRRVTAVPLLRYNEGTGAEVEIAVRTEERSGDPTTLLYVRAANAVNPAALWTALCALLEEGKSAREDGRGSRRCNGTFVFEGVESSAESKRFATFAEAMCEFAVKEGLVTLLVRSAVPSASMSIQI